MDNENKETILRQLTEAIGNRKYFLISAAVTFTLMLAALVTASKHLNSVRNQAVDPRRHVPSRLKQISAKQSKLDELLQDLPRLSHGVPPKLEEQAGTLSCHHPDCIWVDQYLKGRQQVDVHPCSDFYSYACSPNWGTTGLPFSKTPYRLLATRAMVRNLEKYFNGTASRSIPEALHANFLHQVSSLFLDCVIEYKGRGEKETLMDALRQFKLDDFNPMMNASSLVGRLDHDLKLFPFFSVALTPQTYHVVVSPTTTLLKRYHLAFKQGADEDYTRTVSRALGLLTPEADVRKHAENVQALEKRLVSSSSGMVRGNHSAKNTKQRAYPQTILTAWEWDEYFETLMQYGKNFQLSHVSSSPPDLLHRLLVVINGMDFRTVTNYLRYRFLVLVAPFLSEEYGFLLPLGYSYRQETVLARQEACAHSVEGVYSYAFRFIASEANREGLGKDAWKEDQKAIQELVKVSKVVLREHIKREDWMMPSEQENSFAKLNLTEVITDHVLESEISSILHYYSRMSPPPKGASPLQTFLSLKASSSALYWTTDDANLDHDVRVMGTSLEPGYQYEKYSNSLHISPATFGFLGGVSSLPFFIIPVVLPNIILGLLYPIYSSVPAKEFHRHRTQTMMLAETRLCLLEQYYAGMTNILKEDVAIDAEQGNFVELNTMVSLLLDVFQVYKNVTIALTQQVSGVEDNLTGAYMDQMFLTTWATTQCDPTGDVNEKRYVRFMEVPPRLKVDVTMQNFPRFSDVFACDLTSPMNPPLRCRML